MNDDTARRLQIATESIDRMAKYAAHCDELIAAYKDVIARDDHEKQRVTPLPRDPKNQHAMLGHVETLAHRMAWRYKCSRDPNNSDTYTFNRATLLTFADALVAAERERWLKAAAAALELLDDLPVWSNAGHACQLLREALGPNV